MKAHMDFEDWPSGGLEHSLEMPNCGWCSLEVSHCTFIHNTQSQHFRPTKNTSIVMTLTHFCSALSSQFEASNFQDGVSLCQPGKCALSFEWNEKASTETEHERQEDEILPLGGNSLRQTQGWVMG